MITLKVIGYEKKGDIQINLLDYDIVFESLDSPSQKKTVPPLKDYIYKMSNPKKDIKFLLKVVNHNIQKVIGTSEIIIPLTTIKKINNNSSCTFTKSVSLRLEEDSINIKNSEVSLRLSATIAVGGTLLFNKSSSIPKKGHLGLGVTPLSPKIEKNKNNKFKLDMEIKKEFSKLKTPPSKESKNKKAKIFERDSFLLKKNESSSKKYSQTQPGTRGGLMNGCSLKKNEPVKKKVSKTPNRSALQEEDNEEKSSVIDEEVNVELSTSDEENGLLLSNIEGEIEKKYNEIKVSTGSTKKGNTEALKKNIKKQIELCLAYNSLISNQKASEIKTKKKLDDLYIKYNEQYRNTIKMQNRLNELEGKEQIRKIIVNLNTKENSEILSKRQEIKKKELKLYQHIFNKFYFEYDILKFSESESALNLSEDYKMKLLLDCTKAVVDSYGNISSLIPSIEEKEKVQLKNILRKNDIKETILVTNTDSKIKAITEEDEEDEIEDDYTERTETIGRELKKIRSKVPFKHISRNQYQYGTQKIFIKSEEGNLKVFANGSYMTLERFVEINEPIEEVKAKKKVPKRIGSSKSKGSNNRKKGFSPYHSKK